MPNETPQKKWCLAGIQVQYTKINSQTENGLTYESGGDFQCGKCKILIPLPPTFAATAAEAYQTHFESGRKAFNPSIECPILQEIQAREVLVHQSKNGK